MALRNQPYLPLYIQDFLTDEKLNECSAESTGVYIRLMCIMHKSEQYGKLLLKQKHKQTDKQILNFASMLARHLPYDLPVIERSLTELIDEGVLYMEGDFIYQKRMVRDAEISEIRAVSGKKGGDNSLGKKPETNEGFAQAKLQANTENENDNIYILKSLFESFRKKYPGTKRGLDTEFDNLKKKYSDWRDIVKILDENLNRQIEERKKLSFVPEWPNLQTYINQRRWEQEYIGEQQQSKLVRRK